MPGAKQVNKTTMIVHANVVAVFLTFGSSTLDLDPAPYDGQIGGYFTDLFFLNFQSKWLYF